MKKTMIYLDERQQMLLRQKAKERGVSMAALIRGAVDDFLLREKPQVDYLAIVGMAAGQPGERTSERVDEALAELMREGGVETSAGKKAAGGRKGAAGRKKPPAAGRKPRRKAAGG